MNREAVAKELVRLAKAMTGSGYGGHFIDTLDEMITAVEGRIEDEEEPEPGMDSTNPFVVRKMKDVMNYLKAAKRISDNIDIELYIGPRFMR